MDLLQVAAAGSSATAAAAAPLGRRCGSRLLLLVQRQGPPVLVAQGAGPRNAPGTVAEPRLLLLLLLLGRLPLLEEVLLGTAAAWRLRDRLLLRNGCGIDISTNPRWEGMQLSNWVVRCAGWV